MRTCSQCGAIYPLTTAYFYRLRGDLEAICKTCANGAPVGPRPKYRSPEERFWSKVIRRGEDECWTWTGGCCGDGYGSFLVGNKMIKAHRFSYELHVGPIPPGFFILHICDNPSCVNPQHLSLGTHADNMADMQAKGRGIHPRLKGEANGQAVLTEWQIPQIRRAYATGRYTQAQLARTFGVCTATIGVIVRRKRWAHIE